MTKPIDRRAFFKWSATSALGAGLTLATGRVFAAEGAKKAVLRKALCFSMVAGKMSLEDKFKLVKDCGFEGVEPGTINDPQRVEEMMAAAQKAGVRIHSIMNSAHWGSPLSSPDPAVVEKGLAGMRTSLQNAKAFGADAVLLVPAVVKPPVTHEEAWKRSQENIKTLIPMAQELNVKIAIENVWNNFLLTPAEFVKYVDEFQSPFVCVYFDVGNYVKYGPPPDWIRAFGPRLKKIHLKDFKTAVQKKKVTQPDGTVVEKEEVGGSFVPLLEGSIDWKEVKRALDEIGYNGFMTAELKGGDEAYLKDVSARMDKIIAGE